MYKKKLRKSESVQVLKPERAAGHNHKSQLLISAHIADIRAYYKPENIIHGGIISKTITSDWKTTTDLAFLEIKMGVNWSSDLLEPASSNQGSGLKVHLFIILQHGVA